jgi:hypothetical protein
MKLGGFGKGPAGMKLGGFGNGPAGIRLGGFGNGPAGMKLIAGGFGNGPAGMKLGGFGNGPAGMKLIAGGFGNGPAGMKLGGFGNGPAGIAFAVQAVTTSSPRIRTLRIFNLLVLMENAPGGGNPPDNFARKEYPNRVMEATTKVLLGIFFNLSNRLSWAIVIKNVITAHVFALYSPNQIGSRRIIGRVFAPVGCCAHLGNTVRVTSQVGLVSWRESVTFTPVFRLCAGGHA